MSKELIVSVNGREKKIAIVEDDVVTEFYVERGDENQGIVGNIYKGRVMKVLPGMQSAFVDIGLERDSFLYVSDFFDEEDFDESSVEEKEKKEAVRIATAATTTSLRPEKGRTLRPAREEKIVRIDEPEEELVLEASAISHIEELSDEPVREIQPEEEPVEITKQKVAIPENEARSRRRRRLHVQGEEKVEDLKPVLPVIEDVSAVSDIEQEEDGRRRRPRRRKRDDIVESIIVVDEVKGQKAAHTPYILVHHEPLERVTDDDVEGDFLKDAMVQERILGRIHEEEFRAKILDLEPTPEVGVGSLRHTITHEDDVVRIVDEDDVPYTRTPEKFGTYTGDYSSTDSLLVGDVPVEEDLSDSIVIYTDQAEYVEYHEGNSNEKSSRNVDAAEAPETVEANGSLNGNDHAIHASIVTEETSEEVKEEEPAEKLELKDTTVRVRQRGKRGEMATRRGGRGRRRGAPSPRFKGSGPAGAAAEHDDVVDATHDETEELPPLSPSPLTRDINSRQRPVISDLLREGQEIIVQIAKEPIGQKGARITSHIALPGRYIVYMPTVEHIGVSRKIGTDEERMRLKKTLHQLRAEAGAGGGFIVRTAAGGCTTEELREDMQYLVRTWTDMRRRSERTKAPAIIHRDLDLVQRILRDQLSSDFTAIRVDNEIEYEGIIDFVNRFAPKLVNRVKLYTKDTPILEHYGVQTEIDKAVKPRVWLKSGGYIVINQTEALVAIDVNTGKFVGKSNRLEDTITKTNMEAAKEIVRQVRLRDLGGIIILDLIDMEERRNRQKVMQVLEQELKNDRSPSKILQFNDFGLVAITRKRVKQSLERTLCSPCQYCGGGGMIKSAQTICYDILAEARRVSKEVDRYNEVILRVNPEVVKALRGAERDVLREIEDYLGVITIKSDPTIHQEQFDIAVA